VKSIVIEASSDFRLQLATAFGNAGLNKPHFAAGIRETLRLLDGSVDFILTDGNGSASRALGVTRRISGEQAAVGIPIIVITSQRGEAAQLAAAGAGATCVIERPFTPADLIEKIAATVASSRDAVDDSTPTG
jgi:DNA-binding response OmpR family regulator